MTYLWKIFFAKKTTYPAAQSLNEVNLQCVASAAWLGLGNNRLCSEGVFACHYAHEIIMSLRNSRNGRKGFAEGDEDFLDFFNERSGKPMTAGQ